MRRWIIGCLAAAFVAQAAPAFAGTVYVPVAENVEIEGIRYRTQMWVGNEGQVGRSATTIFFAPDVDGTEREGLTENRVGVIAGATVFVSSVAADGASGLLEVTAAPQLAVRAQLQSLIDGEVVDEDALPVVSSENLIEAGLSSQLVPLSHAGNDVTDLILLNLGFEAATCTVAVFQPNGTPLGNAATLQLKALSMRRFEDILATLGDTRVGAARALVSCNQKYYAMAMTTDVQTGQLSVITPAASGSSTLEPPGTEPPPPPPGECPTGAECFTPLTGSFIPSRSNPNQRFQIPVTKNVEFNQLVVQLDVTHGGWYSRLPDGIHNFFYLTRTGGYSSHTFGFVTARGPNRNFVRNEYTVDLPRGQNLKFTQPVVLVPGTSYRVRYVYDFPARQFTLVFTNLATGQQVVNITGAVSRRIRTLGETWVLSISDQEVEAHVPSVNWNYRNLSVQFIR